MLTGIELKNFRGHTHTAVPLTRFTLVVGDNAVGKTSVLESVNVVTGAIHAARNSAARSDAEPGVDILVAEAHQEFDAWVVAGFVPGPKHEKVAHDEAKSRIGFDPLEAPHKLTSNVAGDARDAKALCAKLLGLDGPAHPDHERVRACRFDTDLETLEARGQGAGIAQYLEAVTRVVLPLLGDHA